MLEARAAEPTQSCTRQQVQESKANTRENKPASLFIRPGHKVVLLHASAFLGDPKGDKKGTRWWKSVWQPYLQCRKVALAPGHCSMPPYPTLIEYKASSLRLSDNSPHFTLLLHSVPFDA